MPNLRAPKQGYFKNTYSLTRLIQQAGLCASVVKILSSLPIDNQHLIVENARKMTSSEIIPILQLKFASAITAMHADGKHPRIEISAEHWRPIAEFLRHDPQLELDWLRCLSGLDYAADNKMCCAYDLWSFRHRHIFAVKVFMPRDNPHIPTVSDLWPAANWQEREAFDLFGIIFDGHPDPRRILLADDWVGHPLRKDYVFPREYHGIPGSVELDWKQHPDASK